MMNIMKSGDKKKKHIVDCIYISVMLCALMLPAVFMNNDQEAVSLTSNTELMKWSYVMERNWAWIPKAVEQYTEQRVGFKDTAIYLYEKGIDICFGQLMHPTYAYGEDGHLMSNTDEMISDYQRINTDSNAEFIDSYSEYISETYEYLNERDISFLYFLAPDKQTIYPEAVNSDINVYTENPSRSERIIEKLNDVPHIYPVKEFYDRKPEKLLFNKKIDILHWNKYGEYLGHLLIDDYVVNECKLDVVPLSEKKADIVLKHIDASNLRPSRLYVADDVYEVNFENNWQEDVEDVTTEDPLFNIVRGDFEHYICPGAPNDTVLLLLHDSYMGSSAPFYADRYRESISVHIANYDMIKQMVDLYHPDIVIIENVERVFNCEWFDNETLRDCIRK